MSYNVGRTRARAHLKIALSTEDKEAQLRRLEQALETNAFDKHLTRELESATNQARELALKLGKETAAPPRSRQRDDETDKKASTKSKKQGSKSDKKADATSVTSTVKPAEEQVLNDGDIAAQEAAATRIQAITRGKQTRKQMTQDE